MRGDSVLCTPRTATPSPATCSPHTAARDLEITARGLEDAFLALTGDPDHATARRPHDDHDDPHHRSTRPRDGCPPLGGFNPTVLGIELRRMLRNRRTIIFTLVLPAVVFLSFGSSTAGWQQSVGHGNVAAYVMVSMALYGAALTARRGGAMVAIERALGWCRQLRLTPLRPGGYIAIKALRRAGARRARDRRGQRRRRCSRARPTMPAGVWVACARAHPGSARWSSPPSACSSATCCRARTSCRSSARAWRCSSFLGGLFIPLDPDTAWSADIAKWTPMYGVAEIGPVRR